MYKFPCPICGKPHDTTACPVSIGREMGTNAAKVLAEPMSDFINGLLREKDTKIAKLESELAELREQNRWRKYPDEEPKKWVKVIIKTIHGDYIVTYKVRYNAWFGVPPEWIVEWMPIPFPSATSEVE